MHVGQCVVPYCLLLLVFIMMWWERDLHVLQHSFWWAEPGVTAALAGGGVQGAPPLTNPVAANFSELMGTLQSSVFGSDPIGTGLLPGPDRIAGAESGCGWRAIGSSYSGNLQAIQALYGVVSLWRLAYAQRRVRPSDLDEDEDMAISLDEVVSFTYINLESLFNAILSGLFVAIWASRVAAGEGCENTYYVTVEKNVTSVAALILFMNLMIVCKPLKGVGLLVLTTYKFLVSDVFHFLVMYATFFAAFFLALQTQHNANHVYLAWMDTTNDIVPQVHILPRHSHTHLERVVC